MNYSELSQAIQDFSQNTETSFVTHIPDFVKAAEKKIYRAARIPDTRTRNAAITITNGNNTFVLPTGFLVPLSFKILSGSTEYPVLLKDESFITQAYPLTTYTGRPEVYAVRDDVTGVLGPTPGSGYTGVLNYLSFPTTIVTASNTWLGTYAESALLYGSLINAAIYMKSDADVLQMYRDEFNAEMTLLIAEVGAVKEDEYLGTTLI